MWLFCHFKHISILYILYVYIYMFVLMFIRSIRSETKYTVLSLFSVFPFLFYLHLWAKSSTRRQLPGCSSSLPGLPGPKSGSSFCSNLFISDMLQKEKHCDRSSESTAWHESRSLTKALPKVSEAPSFLPCYSYTPLSSRCCKTCTATTILALFLNFWSLCVTS